MNSIIYEKLRKNRDRHDEDFRREIGIFSGQIGIVLNLLLAISKVFIGLTVSSIAILADGVNNAFDTLSSIVTILGFKIASMPADKGHPYGHGRIEYVASAIVSTFVIMIGLQFIKSSFEQILNPTPVKFDKLFLTIMVFSIIVKLWLYSFNKFVGKKIDSTVLLATAFDSMGDVATTIVVIIPMLASLFTKLNIDGYIGVLVSIMIIYNGISFLKDSLNPLIGEAPPIDLIENLLKELEKYPIITNAHDFVYEDRGGSHGLMVVSVELPGTMTLKKVHRLIDRIERDFYRENNIHLIIHPEPRDHLTEEQKILLEDINLELIDLKGSFRITDFMVIDNKKEILLDIEIIPLEDDENLELLEREILKRLKKVSDYHWNVRMFIGFL